MNIIKAENMKLHFSQIRINFVSGYWAIIILTRKHIPHRNV